jgi:uncharacterized protein YdiU (UPF0061 family)
MTLFFRKLSSEKALDFESFWSILTETTYLGDEELTAEKVHWEMWFENYREMIQKENCNSTERSLKMKAVNPKYVLRNYMAQLAIDAAEKGDNTVVEELYQLLLKPYDAQPEMEKWFVKRPQWAMNKVGCSMLSCSS